ncbi:MAG: transcription antitermination factor NusB [bacterium]
MAKQKRAPTAAQQFIAKRRVARKLALIAVYQWQMTGHRYETIYGNFQQEAELAEDLRKADILFLQSLAKCGMDDELANRINPYLEKRQLDQVDMIEQALLRIATCELIHHPETPYKVVVNETMNLSRKFGAVQGYRLINGVLEKLIKETRALELSAEQQKEKKPAVNDVLDDETTDEVVAQSKALLNKAVNIKRK